MRRLAARLGMALITFLVGVAIASIGFRRESVKSVRLLSGPPCTKGIVSVEPQYQVPLRISISDTACQSIPCSKCAVCSREHQLQANHQI